MSFEILGWHNDICDFITLKDVTSIHDPKSGFLPLFDRGRQTLQKEHGLLRG